MPPRRGLPCVLPSILCLALAGCVGEIGDPASGADAGGAVLDEDGGHGRGRGAPDGAGPPDDPGSQPNGGTGSAGACPAGDLGARIDFDRLLVGGSMDDAQFSDAPFDLRYRYLASDVPAG